MLKNINACFRRKIAVKNILRLYHQQPNLKNFFKFVTVSLVKKRMFF